MPKYLWNGKEYTQDIIWSVDTNGNPVMIPAVDYRPTKTISTSTDAPTGLTSDSASTSAWAIKQAYPASTDGLYWIQNADINGGKAFQIYADMTTQGGGWTLVLQNNFANNWTKDTALLLNSTTPPATLVAEGTYGADDSANYSIYGWADKIKRSAKGFDYMIEAYARGRNGGVWTANQPYNFIDRGASDTNWGEDFTTNSGGFHQDITEIELFKAGSSQDIWASWTYDDASIEHRMPWYADPDVCSPGNALITTTHNDSYCWFGTLVANNEGWTPAPWIQGGVGQHPSVDITKPSVIWMWVR